MTLIPLGGAKMKSWKKELIECVAIIVFATLSWWWVFSQYGKSHAVRVEKKVMSQMEKPIKIYSGAWKKGGYLEVQK